MNLPELPNESRIEIMPKREGLRLSWPWPDEKQRLIGLGILVMMPVTLSIMIWQCQGMDVQGVMVIPFGLFGLLMLVAAIMSMAAGWRFLFPKPETITLTREDFSYDGGYSACLMGSHFQHGPVEVVENAEEYTRRHVSPLDVFRQTLRGVFPVRSRLDLGRFDAPEFRLERDKGKEKQWLRVELDSKEYTIGKTLEDEDLRWLLGFLNAWRAKELKLESQTEPVYGQGQA